jgi:hypothetical protein
MSDVIDELLTRVIEKEPVDWRYHIGDDVFVTIKAPYVCVHIRKHFIPTGEWTYRPTKRGVALHFAEWKELKKNNFMNKHCTSWTCNTVRVQEEGSTVCGHHCIFYLIHRCAGKSMGDVTRTLRHPREATDIVKTFVHRLINKA